MKLSVIIPTRSAGEGLEGLLRSLIPIRQGVDAEDLEIIVAHDGTIVPYAKPAELSDHIIDSPADQAGPAAARNRGARIARGRLLVFFDDDCVVADGCLFNYLIAYEASEGPSVLEGRTSPLGTRSGLDQSAPINEHGGLLWSCNFAIDRQLFLSMGGFHEGFRYPALEDVELRTRLVKSKSPIRFLPEALVLHPWKQRGDWKYFERHQESFRLLVHLHPEQRVSALFYLRSALREFWIDTLPGLFRYRGRGLRTAARIIGQHVVAASRVWREDH